MKLSVASAALVLTYAAAVSAAPSQQWTAVDTVGLTTREIELVSNTISKLDSYNKARALGKDHQLTQRDLNSIVTDVLTAIKNTNLAPGIIEYFISDPTLSSIATNIIVQAVKSGAVNLTTLLTGLNDSGLADQVITTLISDCQFYAQIYKLALNAISNLVNKVFHNAPIPASTKRELSPLHYNAKRDSQTIITNLMTSLKDSGLADQVVQALVVDDDFYTWGGDLISKLFSSGAITLGQILDAVIASGLVPNLIQEFLNFQTFQTVITTALKAAAGQCNASSLSSISQTTTKPASSTKPPTPPSSGPTPTPTSCKKRRKRRAY